MTADVTQWTNPAFRSKIGKRAPLFDHGNYDLVGDASQDVSDDVQGRVIEYWTSVDADLGARVAGGLGRGPGQRAA